MLGGWESWMKICKAAGEVAKGFIEIYWIFPIFSCDIHAHIEEEECKKTIQKWILEVKNEKSEEVSFEIWVWVLVHH